MLSALIAFATPANDKAILIVLSFDEDRLGSRAVARQPPTADAAIMAAAKPKVNR